MLNTSKFNALTIFGGGWTSEPNPLTEHYTERRQALGTGLSPIRLPKGGQRRRGISSRLIDCVGGDSYGE